MKNIFCIILVLFLTISAKSQCAYEHEGYYSGQYVGNPPWENFLSWIVANDSVSFTLYNFVGAPFPYPPPGVNDTINGIINCNNDSVWFIPVYYQIDFYSIIEFFGSGRFYQDTLIINTTSITWTQSYIDTNYNTMIYKQFPVGVKSGNLSTLVKVFPNPAETTITLTLPVNEKIFSVHFYNILGQVVLTKYEENIIDINSISPGLYVLKIITNKNHLYKTNFIKK